MVDENEEVEEVTEYKNLDGVLKRKLRDAYNGMKKRCYSETNREYKHYGKRGITVCEEWLNDRKSFLNWSLKNGFNKDKSLDRIDYNKGYSPNNCRWTDIYTQNNNRSNNVWIEYNGETHTIAQWARILNLDVRIVYARWERGNSPERILSKENLNHRPVLQIDKKTEKVIAEYPSATAASKSVGFKINQISRVCKGERISAAGYYWAYKGEENKPIRKPLSKKVSNMHTGRQ